MLIFNNTSKSYNFKSNLELNLNDEVIVDTEKYPVRFPIYDILEKMKEEA